MQYFPICPSTANVRIGNTFAPHAEHAPAGLRNAFPSGHALLFIQFYQEEKGVIILLVPYTSPAI